jgi:hypothetical protein
MPQFVVVDDEELDGLLADGGINKKTAENRARVVGYILKVYRFLLVTGNS